MYYIHELRSTPEAPHVSRATSQQYLLWQALTDRRAGRVVTRRALPKVYDVNNPGRFGAARSNGVRP